MNRVKKYLEAAKFFNKRIVGFTGTQGGMTAAQKSSLKKLLQKLKPIIFHHGDCLGSDIQASDIAHDLGIKIHLHPPNIDKKRAFCKYADKEEEPKPYMKRNEAMVKATGVYISTPKENIKDWDPDPLTKAKKLASSLRSGTWATTNRAIKKGIPVYIIMKDGSIQEINK